MQFIAAVSGERDSALFVDDAVPGELEFFRAGMQHAHDLARRSRRTGECGDLAIRCDFAARDLADDIDDALVEGCHVGGVGFGARHGENIRMWTGRFKGEEAPSPCPLSRGEGNIRRKLKRSTTRQDERDG